MPVAPCNQRAENTQSHVATYPSSEGQAMILVPALVAVLVLGLSPLGVMLAGALSATVGFSPATWLVILFALAIGGGAAILAFARDFLDPEPSPSEDAPWEIGTGRGQGHFPVLVLVTLAAAVVVLLVADAEPVRLVLTMAAGLLAFVPVPVRASSWPPPLPVFEPPSGAPAQTDPADDEPGESIALSYSWQFADSLSSLDGRGSSFALSLRVPQATYDDFRRREHPQPGDQPPDYSVLATYVRDGLAPPVRRCARLLIEKSVAAKLTYLDVVSFVLAFTEGVVGAHVGAQADDAEPTADGQTSDEAPYAKYPIETLVEQRGSGNDFAVLAAALLRAMGVDAMLWVLPLSDRSVHTALGVRALAQTSSVRPPLEFEGQGYYYCEVAPAATRRIGELPVELAGKVTRQIPILLDGP